MFFLLSIAALLTAVDANSTDLTSQPALIAGYRFLASVECNGYHKCGGSIISSRYVITSSSCIDGCPPDILTVRVRTSIREYGGKVYRVAEVKSHEKYHINFYNVPVNDIALIRLEQQLRPKYNWPIKLVTSFADIYPGSNGFIVGWATATSTNSSMEMNRVDVPIVENKLCDYAYLKIGGRPDDKICAGYHDSQDGENDCAGDLGGPLVVNSRLAGIVSGSRGCAKDMYPGMFTGIVYYGDWIHKHANGLD